MQHYDWNKDFWQRHLSDKDAMDLFEQLWLRRHLDFLGSLPKGRVLDLGCGLGQYTELWHALGFSVVSSDISTDALQQLKDRIPEAATLPLDMTQPLPFEDESFDVVFASLSIHYFSEAQTDALLAQIRRILKPGGHFIGSVNATEAYVYIQDTAVTLEENFYLTDGRYIRLFDRAAFDRFFQGFDKVLLEFTHTVRFKKPKDQWEFIYRRPV